MDANTSQIVRVELGALLALKELAEIEASPEAIADFADLTIRAVSQSMSIELTPSFAERLKDENLIFIANSGLLRE